MFSWRGFSHRNLSRNALHSSFLRDGLQITLSLFLAGTDLLTTQRGNCNRRSLMFRIVYLPLIVYFFRCCTCSFSSPLETSVTVFCCSSHYSLIKAIEFPNVHPIFRYYSTPSFAEIFSPFSRMCRLGLWSSDSRGHTFQGVAKSERADCGHESVPLTVQYSCCGW